MPKRKHSRASRIVATLLAALLFLTGALAATLAALPDTFYTDAETHEAGTLKIASMPWVQIRPARPAETAQVGGVQKDTSRNDTVTLFGVLPLKTVRTVTSQRRSVTLCGTPFGIKMFSDGALVVAFSDRYTALGTENPAKEAGLRLGDLIISAGGKEIRTNDELTAAITQAAGNPLQIVYLRDGQQHSCTLTPVADATTGAYKAGLWVRDSSAGIGTLTFIDTARSTFAGLGHAISDTDTGAQLPLLSGEIVPVMITGCVSGAAGSPGELRGEFSGGETLGTVLANDATGVYGRWNGASTGGQMLPLSYPQEIELGDAQIVTTVKGGTAKTYSVRIERVNMTSNDPNRNLLLRVTDPELLEATGGIVQGMSGSPIVQNGRLIGAVTHVLVNDPTRGYGIFATTMLEKADSLQG